MSECPECGKQVRTTRSGRVGAHTVRRNGKTEVCQGEGSFS